MTFRIRYNLWKTKNDLNPSRQFKRELGALLSKRFEELHSDHSVWHRIVVAKVTRVIIASSVGVSMVGTGAYAYNSPDVTVGTTLYPIKIGMENIIESTKTSPEAKVKFLLKKIERREAEKQTIVGRVGSEIKLTFSAVAPTTTGSSTIIFTTTSITVSAKPAEVEEADLEVRAVEHQLAALRNILTEEPQDQYLSSKIGERLDRHQKEDEEEDRTPASSSVSTSTIATSTVSEFSVVHDDENGEQKIEVKRGIVESGKRLFRNVSVEKPDTIKIVQGENGRIRVKDSEREYKIYTNSTSPEQLRQIFATSSRIRLEIRNKENEVRSLTLEHDRSDEINSSPQKTVTTSPAIPRPEPERRNNQKRGWDKNIRNRRGEDQKQPQPTPELKKIEQKTEDEQRDVRKLIILPTSTPATTTVETRNSSSTISTTTEQRESDRSLTSTTSTNSGNSRPESESSGATSTPREHDDD